MRWQWISRADPNAVKHIKNDTSARVSAQPVHGRQKNHTQAHRHTCHSGKSRTAQMRYDTNDWAGETEPKNYYNTVNGEQ